MSRTDVADDDADDEPGLDPRVLAALGSTAWRDRLEDLTGSPVLAGVVVVVALAVGGWLLGAWGSGGEAGLELPAPPGVSVEGAAPAATGPSGTDVEPAAPTPAAAASEGAPSVAPVVHVAGAVVAPGVVVLASGARVTDAVAAAGGARPDADLDRLNLAATVEDGARIYVPRTDEPVVPAPIGPTPSPAGGTGTDEAGPVSLSTATADQLEALPGIGPATAAAIIDHRQRSGPFRTVDDLLDVRGIGEAKLEALRPLVVP